MDGCDNTIDMTATDRELLRRIARDPAALEEFYRRHVRKVTRLAARRARSGEDLADIVAAVFLQVLESSNRFNVRRGDPVPWLLGITVNVANASGRRNRRDREVVRRITAVPPLAPDAYEELEERIDAERMSGEIAEALESLTGRERAIFELVALESLSPIEAARALGVTGATARMRLTRARRKLKDALSEHSTIDIEWPTTVLPKGDTP